MLVAMAFGCGGGKTENGSMPDGQQSGDGPLANGPKLPRITPIVRAALPPGLGGTAPQGVAPILNTSDIKGRFFEGNGPTDIFRILMGVDGLIDDINQRTGDCMTQTPVAYTVEAWGQTLTVYAQCLLDMHAPEGSPPSFTQFGKAPDGTTWINVAIAGSSLLAQLTPSTTATGEYAVHTWLTIPVNTLDCSTSTRGSYGVVEIIADESTAAFEMAVAGTGFGYCGAQLKSDGTSVYIKGSPDSGSNCGAIDSTCGAASDVSMPATCGTSTTDFALTPLGRIAVSSCNVGGSQYPASGNTVDVSGTATDSVQTFQLTAPTPGVGSI